MVEYIHRLDRIARAFDYTSKYYLDYRTIRDCIAADCEAELDDIVRALDTQPYRLFDLLIADIRAGILQVCVAQNPVSLATRYGSDYAAHMPIGQLLVELCENYPPATQDELAEKFGPKSDVIGRLREI